MSIRFTAMEAIVETFSVQEITAGGSHTATTSIGVADLTTPGPT